LIFLAAFPWPLTCVADENSKRISVVFFPNCSFHIFHGVIPCFPYSRNFTYFPLIDLLNRTLGIGESDPPKLVWEKIESGLDFVERKEEVVPYVGSLYNFDYPELERLSPET
jgi:hypothetical protein